MRNNKIGTLYVVATPIGNLQDMTLRAIDVLKSVDWIAAEDTRHSGHLLKHFSIDKPTISLHEYNERKRLSTIVSYLMEGQSIALISDAGTPLISDPGFYLVKEARALGVSVVPIPGPSALIAALSVSGLPTDKFTFQGFLPAKGGARRHALAALIQETATMIFYEAPHRLMDALKTMADVFGGTRVAVIARELTKVHESIISSDLQTHIDRLHEEANAARGEIVILIAGSDLKEQEEKAEFIQKEKVLDLLLAELPLKRAVIVASQLTGIRKNIFYQMALKKKAQQ